MDRRGSILTAILTRDYAGDGGRDSSDTWDPSARDGASVRVARRPTPECPFAAAVLPVRRGREHPGQSEQSPAPHRRRDRGCRRGATKRRSPGGAWRRVPTHRRGGPMQRQVAPPARDERTNPSCMNNSAAPTGMQPIIGAFPWPGRERGVTAMPMDGLTPGRGTRSAQRLLDPHQVPRAPPP